MQFFSAIQSGKASQNYAKRAKRKVNCAIFPSDCEICKVTVTCAREQMFSIDE